MAIAPIDLQTLFSQVDKVGKTQAAQREGQALQQAIQGVQLQQKADKQIHQVNETQNSGEGAEKIKDSDQNRRQDTQSRGKEKNQNNSTEDEKPHSFLRDPNLGKKIDISL